MKQQKILADAGIDDRSWW